MTMENYAESVNEWVTLNEWLWRVTSQEKYGDDGEWNVEDL